MNILNFDDILLAYILWLSNLTTSNVSMICQRFHRLVIFMDCPQTHTSRITYKARLSYFARIGELRTPHVNIYYVDTWYTEFKELSLNITSHNILRYAPTNRIRIKNVNDSNAVIVCGKIINIHDSNGIVTINRNSNIINRLVSIYCGNGKNGTIEVCREYKLLLFFP